MYERKILTIDQDSKRDYMLPVVNVVSVPHSGSRSVAKWASNAGAYARLLHVQQHYNRPDEIISIVGLDPCFVVVRDPLEVLLSTQARDDDSIDSALLNISDFYSMTWPGGVITIDFDGRMPVIGAIVYPEKSFYANRDLAAIKMAAPWFSRLQAMESLIRPRLEPLGYSSLMWWS